MTTATIRILGARGLRRHTAATATVEPSGAPRPERRDGITTAPPPGLHWYAMLLAPRH